jgi:hypothetical protein
MIGVDDQCGVIVKHIGRTGIDPVHSHHILHTASFFAGNQDGCD